MDFACWGSDLHETPEQVKRIVSAKKISASKITVNQESKTAIVSGSSETPYTVTLETCTCGDFIARKLPCKHIYRLALELGLVSDLPELNPEAAAAFDVDGEIQRYYIAYRNGAISGDKFAKIADALQKGK